MKIILLTFTAIFLASCATKNCNCLREMPIENNPLVIPKDLDGNPITIPTPEE